jgi:hypothetical protein
MSKRLVLHPYSESDREFGVFTSESDEYGHESETRIGRVYRHKDRFGGGEHILLWSARDVNEVNHGDQYLDQLCAAKQLALGLKIPIRG